MELLDMVFHYRGRWEFNLKLSYVGGESDVVENFDIDFLSYPHIMKKYHVYLGYPNVKKNALKLGKSLDCGLFLLQDDMSIMYIMNQIKKFGGNQMHIYVEHDVDVPLFIPN